MKQTAHNKQFDGLYIGLMSGTSCDGIDCALVCFQQEQTTLLENCFLPFDPELRQWIIDISHAKNDSLDQVARLDYQLGMKFAQAVNKLLQKSGRQPQDILAIGSHGQTIRHQPDINTPYSIQIGNPNLIAYLTGITTVSDFRRKDMAAGGQGAPLVPAFHAHLFHSKQDQVIVNIGGMANISYITSNPCHIQGFDTGPGNILIDSWMNYCYRKNYDFNGETASSGKVIQHLLELFLQEDFFQHAPPKSTGRETFNLEWILRQLKRYNKPCKNEDVLCTLTELTAYTINADIQQYAASARRIIICGGGSKNSYLMKRLQKHSKITLLKSDQLGINSDWIEAMAFAWLAQQTLKEQAANIPEVTGAKEAVILGAVYPV